MSLTSDRVCLDYQNYEGNLVRLMFRRCTPLGDIAQLSAAHSFSVTWPDSLTRCHRLHLTGSATAGTSGNLARSNQSRKLIVKNETLDGPPSFPACRLSILCEALPSTPLGRVFHCLQTLAEHRAHILVVVKILQKEVHQ